MNTEINNYTSFKRALTSKEKKAYISCIQEAKKRLNIQDTTAIMFDYFVPVEAGKNLGIGSSFSYNAQKFVNFIKEYCGINSLQLNPQGILKEDTVSPYSATSLSIGEHIIDLFMLTENRFKNILKPNEIKKYLIKENPDEVCKTRYDKLVRQDYREEAGKFVFSDLLAKAYKRFKALDEKSELKEEFREFCKNNGYRLDREALYYALAEKFQSTQWQNWKNYGDLFIKGDREGRLLEENKDRVLYHKFVQFIADCEQKESKRLFNQNGVKIYGDIPISFSPAEQWANKSVFRNNYRFGYFDNGAYHDWGSPAPDMDKFTDKEYRAKIEKVFADRYKANLERYDGIRIDAAWEIVNPCVVKWKPEKSEGKFVNNINDALLNLLVKVAKSVKKDKYDPHMLMFELLGGEEINKAVGYTKNKFPHTLITENVAWGAGTVNGYHRYGFEDNMFTVGIGTHDNPPLIELSEKLNSKNPADKNFIQADIEELSKNMQVKKEFLNEPANYRTLKFAEIFTTPRQFLNTFDILGLNKYINKWDSLSGDYWSNRIPINYEKLYFKNLTENKGLNLPETLYYAIKSKYKENNPLLENLKKFAGILKEKGPLTEKEANSNILWNFFKSFS